MSVQVHDNDIESCLLIVLLIQAYSVFYRNVFNHFRKHCISKLAFRIMKKENEKKN